MHSEKPKIVCITGIDGSGKSTVIKQLCEHYSRSVHCHIWQLLEETDGLPFRSKSAIDNYLCELTPDARLLFLSHALKYAIDSCLQKDPQYIFINGYYFKYFAGELVLGADKLLIDNLIKSFIVPDITFRLNISIASAAARKTRLSRYECGLATNPNSDSFLQFQQLCMLEWEAYQKNNWVNIDASKSVSDIIYTIENKLNKWV